MTSPAAIAEDPPTTAAPEAAPAPAPATPVVAEGVRVEDIPVEGVVLSRAHLRRQLREQRREFMIRSCTNSADVAVEVLPKVCIVGFAATLACVWASVGTLVVQQMVVPPGVGRREPFVACAHLHVIPVAIRMLSTLCCVVVGCQDVCIATFGTDSYWVQRQRLAWLFYVVLIEAISLIPLVQPLSLSTVASNGGACEVDSALLALVRDPTPVHALTALATCVFYFHGVVTCLLCGFIFGALGMGLCLEKPHRFVAAGLLVAFGSVCALYYQLYSRWLGNATNFIVAVIDKLLTRVLCHVLGLSAEACPEDTGSSFGPYAVFLKQPIGKDLSPMLLWAFGSVFSAMLANMCVYTMGVYRSTH